MVFSFNMTQKYQRLKSKCLYSKYCINLKLRSFTSFEQYGEEAGKTHFHYFSKISFTISFSDTNQQCNFNIE